MEITKANESLKAAEHCYTDGLYNSSVSRAYYSMYQAAQVALEAAGFNAPSGLTEDCTRLLTRRRKLYSSFLARDLNVVQDLRHTADYRDSDVSKRQATRALAKAREFVSLIKKGISNG
ncbi:MAG: HEPN domain-containing protein [Candidatus Binatia bacterium]